MQLFELNLVVRFPDVRPDDLDLLEEVAAALPPYTSGEVSDRLVNLSDRIARMLLTSEHRAD